MSEGYTDRSGGRNRSPVRRSVEVEYWVVDETGELVDPGGLETAPGAEREFVEPLLEVKTTPCETTAALREELRGRLRSVLRRADDLDRRLVPLGTPLAGEEIAELRSDRTRIQNRVVGEPFRYVRHCAGTHVHVEQQPDRAVDQFNAFVALDPALALVNSAPYFQGDRVAAGARSELYRRRAYEDLPHQGRLWRYLSDEGEWNRRLERRYERFVTAALDAGVDRAAVEAAFDPESAVWTPVQFRAAFDTVEWRSPDAALPGQVLRLADQLAAFVDRLRDTPVRIEGTRGRVSPDEIVLPEFSAVVDYVDAAIEDGLASDAVHGYLDRMGFEPASFEPLSAELDGQAPVSREAARRLRLEYADRLERDLRRTNSIDAD